MSRSALIMAGGTGGHVFPALAVAQMLQAQNVKVTWLGTKKGLEADVVPKAGIEIDWITINGLRGNGIVGWFLAPYKLLVAMLQARKAIQKRKPDFVLGMGGFVAGPGGVVAWLNGIPLIIHEQNAIPGMTNRLLSIIAKHVLQAFPNAFEASKNALTIGNPIRETFVNVMPPLERFSSREGSNFRLLVVGGSLGALALNNVMPKAIAKLQEETSIDVWHQTGKRHYENTLALYNKTNVTAKVAPFIEDMMEAYSWADIVICRSGALTVSELAAVGVGSILVPFPHAVDDHQTKNGQFLVDSGAAILIQQKDLKEEELVTVLSDFVAHRSKVIQMAEAAYAVRKIDAADIVVKQCYEAAYV